MRLKVRALHMHRTLLKPWQRSILVGGGGSEAGWKAGRGLRKTWDPPQSPSPGSPEQGSANSGPLAKLGQPPPFVNKALLARAINTFIHLHIVWGYFNATTAELSRCSSCSSVARSLQSPRCGRQKRKVADPWNKTLRSPFTSHRLPRWTLSLSRPLTQLPRYGQNPEKHLCSSWDPTYCTPPSCSLRHVGRALG